MRFLDWFRSHGYSLRPCPGYVQFLKILWKRQSPCMWSTSWSSAGFWKPFKATLVVLLSDILSTWCNLSHLRVLTISDVSCIPALFIISSLAMRSCHDFSVDAATVKHIYITDAGCTFHVSHACWAVDNTMDEYRRKLMALLIKWPDQFGRSRCNTDAALTNLARVSALV